MSGITIQPADLDAALLSLRKDWGRLAARLRTLEHDIVARDARLNIRLHYPALRDAAATVTELVEVIKLFIPSFCLPRKEIDDLYARRGTTSDFEYHTDITALNARALNLFMRAQAAKGRSGEAGELLLYLLTEWLLDAPQIVAKMSLKTNRDMPVHGSDGIHVKFIPQGRRLILYSGEAKMHANVGNAVRSAAASIAKALAPGGIDRELALVRRDLDLSGLPMDAREALLGYLNPWDERSNQRVDAVTCLIGFDFLGYQRLRSAADAEGMFRRLALEQLRRTKDAFVHAMAEAGLDGRSVELFLMPLPSVATFRSLFLESTGGKTI